MLDTDYRLIPLHDAQGNVKAHAIVDPEDFERFGHLRWGASGNGYVTHDSARMGRVRLNRLILGLTPGDGLKGDHINGNPLDNRRSNLRIATQAQNGQNRVKLSRRNKSGYRGVSYTTREGTWSAEIMVDGVRYRKAGFRSPEQAAEMARALRAKYMPFARD